MIIHSTVGTKHSYFFPSSRRSSGGKKGANTVTEIKREHSNAHCAKGQIAATSLETANYCLSCGVICREAAGREIAFRGKGGNTRVSWLHLRQRYSVDIPRRPQITMFVQKARQPYLFVSVLRCVAPALEHAHHKTNATRRDSDFLACPTVEIPSAPFVRPSRT